MLLFDPKKHPTHMKKLKLSLAAIAFVIATGAAFATNTKSDLPPCSSTPECVPQGDEPCCVIDITQDPNDPSNQLRFPQ